MGQNEENDGMELRDYFAAKVIGMLVYSDVTDGKSWVELAEMAYKSADAMMKVRKEKL